MDAKSRNTDLAPSVRRRSVRTHGAILEAAAELVAERGYNRVTVEAIAARAAAGKQSVYRWWPSKAFLFIELYRRLVPETALVPDPGPDHGSSAEDELRALLINLFALYAETPAKQILAGVVAEAQSEPEVARSLQQELVEKRRSIVRGILERGVARGELRADADLDFTVDLVSSVVWFRLLLGQAPLDSAFAEQTVAQIFQGIGKEARQP